MNTVIIKKYSSDFEAQNDAALLEANGIDCAVYGSATESVMPYLQNIITLSVMENNEQEAKKLLQITD